MRFNKFILFFVAVIFLVCIGVTRNAISFRNVLPMFKKKVERSSLELNPNEGLVYYQNEPFTGTSVSYYHNGNLAEFIDYLDGKKHGFFRKFFENSELSFDSQYINGKQHGTAKSWWENGNLRAALNYENGIAHGMQKQWYKSGAKFKFIHLVNGREEGLQQSWRENGKLYNNYEARNGRIFGLKRANLCYDLDNEKIQLASD